MFVWRVGEGPSPPLLPRSDSLTCACISVVVAPSTSLSLKVDHATAGGISVIDSDL